MPDLPQCAYNLQSGPILVELNGKLKVMRSTYIVSSDWANRVNVCL